MAFLNAHGLHESPTTNGPHDLTSDELEVLAGRSVSHISHCCAVSGFSNVQAGQAHSTRGGGGGGGGDGACALQ